MSNLTIIINDILDDMPALECGNCNNASSKGGCKWEEEHPSVMCTCPKFRDKRLVSEPKLDNAERFIQN